MELDIMDKQKNDRYRQSYPKMLLVFVYLCILAVFLTVILVYITIKEPEDKNYAALNTGRIVEIYPYAEPVLTDHYIRSWATLASRSVLNLSFNNYQEELKKASVYFQPEAFSLLSKALTDNGYLKTLTASKLIMRSYVNDTVVIVWQGLESGDFVWKVQLPVTISYEGASSNVTRSIVVKMTIVRVPTVDNPHAILIKSISL